jgi:hypothetical protein
MESHYIRGDSVSSIVLCERSHLSKIIGTRPILLQYGSNSELPSTNAYAYVYHLTIMQSLTASGIKSFATATTARASCTCTRTSRMLEYFLPLDLCPYILSCRIEAIMMTERYLGSLSRPRCTTTVSLSVVKFQMFHWTQLHAKPGLLLRRKTWPSSTVCSINGEKSMQKSRPAGPRRRDGNLSGHGK